MLLGRSWTIQHTLMWSFFFQEKRIRIVHHAKFTQRELCSGGPTIFELVRWVLGLSPYATDSMTVFQAGFVESTSMSIQLALKGRVEHQAENESITSSTDGSLTLGFDDSDEEEEEDSPDTDSDHSHEDIEIRDVVSDVETSHMSTRNSTVETALSETEPTVTAVQSGSSKVSEEVDIDMDGRNYRAKHDDKEQMEIDNTARDTRSSILGPPKITIVVKDVAYSTYRSVLYYVSTLTRQI